MNIGQLGIKYRSEYYHVESTATMIQKVIEVCIGDDFISELNSRYFH